MASVESGVDLAQWSLDQARAAGADAAEVLIVSGESLSAGVRMGEVEKLKSSRERRLGVRVFVGKSSATASTAEFERKALGDFVADTVRLARLTAPDPMVRPARSGATSAGHPGTRPLRSRERNYRRRPRA